MSLACPLVIAAYSSDLCRAVDIYCERTSSALDAEPVNALTNAAFVISALCAWRLQSARPNQDGAGLIWALILCTALVGLGSFLFHTVATRWAEWGDVIPILLFMLLFLRLVLTRLFGWSPSTTLIALALFFAATLYLEAAVPSEILSGGALYLPALLALIAITAALYSRQPAAGRPMSAATLVLLLSFAARTLDAPSCGRFPLGTHFLWHLLNAILLFLLVRVAIEHAPRGQSADENKI